MQNVLPALALSPPRIILLHTRRTAAQCQWIAAALRKAGRTFDLRLQPLSDMPDTLETGAAVLRSIGESRKDGLSPLVNFTGGTKLMSIGAFAATLKPLCPSCYVDTENRRFVDGGQVPAHPALSDAWALIQQAEQALNVDVLAAAHGHERISSGRDPEPLLALAEDLRTHPSEEQECQRIFSRVNLRNLKPSQALAVLDTPLTGVPSRIADLAVAAGLINRRNSGLFLPCPLRDSLERWANGNRWDSPADLYSALAPMQQAQAFLAGSWWEIVVWNAARQSGRFRDLRWSVEIGAPGEAIEEDILAVDGFNLAIFSCKRGGDGARLTRAFEEFESAARLIGGTFSSKFFCVAQAISERNLSLVRKEAARARVTLIGPYQRLSASLFAGT
jgi:hypothetical protein